MLGPEHYFSLFESSFATSTGSLAYGVGQVIVMIFTSFVSEDLTLLSSLLLNSLGKISAEVFFIGNISGMLIGDALLYYCGYLISRNRKTLFGISLARLKNLTKDHETKSGWVIFFCRFIPGTRLAVYVSSGIGNYPFPSFLFINLISILIWVGAFFMVGHHVAEVFLMYFSGSFLIFMFLVLCFMLWLSITLMQNTYKIPLKYRIQSIRRFMCFEYWPTSIFQAPVLAYYIVYAVLRYRRLTVVLAANPMIFSGGLSGESKHEIYKTIPEKHPGFLKYSFVDGDLEVSEKLKTVKSFMKKHKLKYPIILKPDVGQKGYGVRLIKSESEAIDYFHQSEVHLVVQEYCDHNEEAGVFYYRMPTEKTGIIYSINRKVFPKVTGDGISTIRDLILCHPRISFRAPKYMKRFVNRLDDVLKKGQVLRLVESGNHAQGAIFVRQDNLASNALLKKLDQLSHDMKGFYYGRLDVRFESEAALKKGHFKIIEANGVGAEPTHIYEPGYPILKAYRELFFIWRVACRIGNQNIKSGVKPTPLSIFLKRLFASQSEMRSLSDGS